MKDPVIFSNFLSKDDFKTLQDYVVGLDKTSTNFSEQFNRYEFGGSDILNLLHTKLTDFARDFFENPSIVPSFNFGSWYFGDASLEKHRDVNACQYSIDMCVYQKEPWDLYIEGKPYTLMENEAVLYYGEEQRHWREKFPNPEYNVVCNVFFFFVDSEHWFLKEPSENHDKIRRQNAILRNY